MNIGDYVRTIKGKIYKLTENDLKFEMTKQNCKISSPNIIDLIEVGDYVNKKYLDEDELKWYRKYPEYIKYVATKEQMEAMEYKVGE